MTVKRLLASHWDNITQDSPQRLQAALRCPCLLVVAGPASLDMLHGWIPSRTTSEFSEVHSYHHSTDQDHTRAGTSPRKAGLMLTSPAYTQPGRTQTIVFSGIRFSTWRDSSSGKEKIMLPKTRTILVCSNRTHRSGMNAEGREMASTLLLCYCPVTRTILLSAQNSLLR